MNYCLGIEKNSLTPKSTHAGHFLKNSGPFQPCFLFPPFQNEWFCFVLIRNTKRNSIYMKMTGNRNEFRARTRLDTGATGNSEIKRRKSVWRNKLHRLIAPLSAAKAARRITTPSAMECKSQAACRVSSILSLCHIAPTVQQYPFNSWVERGTLRVNELLEISLSVNNGCTTDAFQCRITRIVKVYLCFLKLSLLHHVTILFHLVISFKLSLTDFS